MKKTTLEHQAPSATVHRMPSFRSGTLSSVWQHSRTKRRPRCSRGCPNPLNRYRHDCSLFSTNADPSHDLLPLREEHFEVEKQRMLCARLSTLTKADTSGIGRCFSCGVSSMFYSSIKVPKQTTSVSIDLLPVRDRRRQIAVL